MFSTILGLSSSLVVGISVLVRRLNILCAGELSRPSVGVFLHVNKAR